MTDQTPERANTTDEYQSWLADNAARDAQQRADTPPVAVPEDTGTVNVSAVQRMIDQALARQQQEHDRALKGLRDELTAVRLQLPLSLVPEHAGGIGVDNFAGSWSEYDRQLAARGEHPHQSGVSADWLEHPDDVDIRQGPGNSVLRTRTSAEVATSA